MASNTRPSYPLLNDEVHAPHFRDIISRRLDQFEGGRYANLTITGALFEHRTDSHDSVKLEVWTPDDPHSKPTFEQAVRAKNYRPYKKGDRLGPSWTNHWVRAILDVPAEWRDKEVVQFEFDPGCEAMVYNSEGLPLQGITGGYGGDRRVEHLLNHRARSFTYKIYLEVSCNGMFGNANGDSIDPPDPNRYFSLASADIVVPRMEAWRLLWDFRILKDISREVPSNSPLQNKAFATANAIVNTFNHEDLSTISKCRKLAEQVLGEGWQQKGAGIYDNKEDIKCFSVANCHIDTAWLWPYSVTQQKVARSWSTQCDLMDRYPEHRFVASQAQQFKWLENLYPKLFDVVKGKIDAGTFLPIGGTWVEMDTNMPSGEALCRQFIYGQRYFKSRFGSRCETFWLPDTFGYSSQLPQLSRSAGMKYFFTQKLSWSQFNKFPHTTFNWVGLDGTQLLTHMTPVDTYTAQASVGDVRNAVVRHKNLEQTDIGLLPFGNGDGGGGAIPQMLEGLRRIRAAADNSRDLPKHSMGVTVDDMFHAIEEQTESGKTLVTWRGELYLELHRGTYTSHASIKKGNRKSEILLREVEFVSTLASVSGGKSNMRGPYLFPKDQIDPLWEGVLLNQFHDVLPGSAIALAYVDAEKIYADVREKGGALLESALEALIPGSKPFDNPPVIGDEATFMAFNTSPYPRREVVKIPFHDADVHLYGNACAQVSRDQTSAYLLVEDADSRGVATMVTSPVEPATASMSGDGFYILQNAFLEVRVSDKGRVTQILDLQANRQLIPDGKSAGFVTFQDRPLYWDAWDVDVFHLETPTHLDASVVSIAETGPLRASLFAQYRVGKSVIEVFISLDAVAASVQDNALSLLRFETEVHWHEQHVFLKFEAPIDINSETATFETQFGNISRPTHRNTTWDAAKFEVCGHKFADLSEYGYGVALLNDCKYGYAVEGNVMRLSLLRSSTAPDPNQDQGKHTFQFALLPHRGHFIESDVPIVGWLFNTPMHLRRVGADVAAQWISTRGPFQIRNGRNVILDTVKRGDDDDFFNAGSGKTVVLRLYEAYGGHASPEIITTLPVETAALANILEEDEEPVQITRSQGASGETISIISIGLRAYQVVTLKLYLPGNRESSRNSAPHPSDEGNEWVHVGQGYQVNYVQ